MNKELGTGFDAGQIEAESLKREAWHRPKLTALPIDLHTRNFSYNGSDGTGNFTGS